MQNEPLVMSQLQLLSSSVFHAPSFPPPLLPKHSQ